jgi:hypothetical protein
MHPPIVKQALDVHLPSLRHFLLQTLQSQQWHCP